VLSVLILCDAKRTEPVNKGIVYVAYRSFLDAVSEFCSAMLQVVIRVVSGANLVPTEDTHGSLAWSKPKD